MSDIFEKATREFLRFDTKAGSLATEDLWSCSLTFLDSLAVGLKRTLDQEQVSFLGNEKKDKNLQLIQLRFDIVLHIINTKLQEEQEMASAAEKKAKRDKRLELLADKEYFELAEKSKEELLKEIEELSN